MAPDLTGYASREWLTAFISNPADERFYRDKNDRMPAFAPHRTIIANRVAAGGGEIAVRRVVAAASGTRGIPRTPPGK